MKLVKFIKRHVSGIEIDEEKKVTDDHAKRLLKDGYVKVMGDIEEEEDNENLLGGKPPKQKTR